MYETIRNYITSGRLNDAFKATAAWTQNIGDSTLQEEFDLLQARYQGNEQRNNKGLVAYHDYLATQNNLTKSIFRFLNKLKQAAETQNSYQLAGNDHIVLQNISGSQINIGGNTPKASTNSKRKILFLAANPTDASRLQTDKEYRIIKAELERGQHRDAFEFVLPQLSLTIGELIRAMTAKPEIVHFSGHGIKKGIVTVQDNNQSQIIPLPALQRLFKRVKGHTQIVVLNACYSADQAKVISQLGMYVIGNNLPIGDDAAISFAKGFYIGLGDGKTVEEAFDDAMIVLLTENAKYVDVVEIWKDGVQLDL